MTTTASSPVADAAKAACRAVARASAAQARVERTHHQVRDTLATIGYESAVADQYTAAAAAAAARGDHAQARVEQTTAAFITTQVARLYADPDMVAYTNAAAAAHTTQVAAAHALGVLDQCTTPA